MRKIACVFLFCLVLAFCACPTAFSANDAPLVILLYMTGSNLESEGGSASADIEEIMAHLPQHQNIRVIAMISGSDQWRLDISRDETSIYEISRNSLTKIRRLDSRSMGDPDTLSSFLSFSQKQYPAQRYALIIWNHGAGPLIGVCFDENYKTGQEMDHLTMEELNQALSSSPFADRKLTFIGFDACLMASLEVASVVAPYADYMIASQETEPSSGWNYAFLQELNGDENGGEIGESIIQAYEASLKGSSRAATLSCLDLRRTDAVMNALNRLFADMETNVNPVSYPDYARIRADSKVFGTSTTSDYDLVDLVDLLEMYQAEHLADCSEPISLIQDMVVSQFAARNDEYVHGVSIYYPFDNKSKYETEWAALYRHLPFIPEYQSYIQRLTDIYMGEQLLDWRSDYHLEMMDEAGAVHLSIRLTPEEIRNAVRSRLIVVEEIQQGVYQHIYYADGPIIRKTDTEISAVYHGEALYLVSPEGEILAGPVSWYPVEGGICIYGIAEYAINWENMDWTQHMEYQKFEEPVQLVYHLDEKGGLSFTDLILLGNAQSGMNLPSSMGLDAFSALKIINTGVESVTSLDHFLLAHPLSYRVPLANEAPRFAFLPVFGSNHRHAYIRITDSQGNTICSNPSRIDNPTRIPLAQQQSFPEQNKIRVTLKSADLITGFQSGIKCTFSVRNGSDAVRQVTAEQVSLENTPIHQALWYRNVLAPGAEDEFIVFISGSAIRDSGVQEANSLTVAICLKDENGEVETIDARIMLQVNTAIFSAAGDESTPEE